MASITPANDARIAEREPRHALFVPKERSVRLREDVYGDEREELHHRPFVERRERGGVSLAWLPPITPEHLPALRRVLGIDEGVWASCPLPGHHGSASIDERDNGELVLWCSCLGSERTVTVKLRGSDRTMEHSLGEAWPHWYSLSDAYLAVATGKALNRGFRTNHRLVWRLLLSVALGLVESVPVQLPEAQLSGQARAVAEFFVRLYGAQVGAGWPEPGAFAVRMVWEWCGCSQQEAHDAIHELVERGVIAQVGKVGLTFRYEPGRLVR